MRPEDLLAEVKARGVVLRAEGDRLRFRPIHRVPPELREELRQHKAQIIEFLHSARPTLSDVFPEGVRPVRQPVATEELLQMPLRTFAGARIVVRVWSELVSERLILASDNARLDPGEREVVYRAAELWQLLDLGSEHLKWVHNIKRIFGGTILPS
jgi:hypothetical protein